MQDISPTALLQHIFRTVLPSKSVTLFKHLSIA